MRSRAHWGRRHAAVGIFCLIPQLFAGTDLAAGHRIRRGKSKGDEPQPLADPASTPGLLLFDKTTYNNTSECNVEEIIEGLVDAVGADDQVNVVGEVFLGELLCDTLASAEDAPMLRFAISPEETIVAEKTSYSVFSGEAFADGIGRKVWAGEVAHNNSAPFIRTVSMSWGTVCNVETFLVKVTTVYENGILSLAKSVPCIPNEDTTTCFVEVELESEEEDDLNLSVEGTDDSNSTTPNQEAGGSTSVPCEHGSTKTKIDVMMLFNEGGKEKLGGISDAQMQTTLATALSSSNEALVHSGINLEFSLVHVGLLPYNDLSTSSSTVLDNLGQNKDVAELRDAHSADLVQLVGDIGFYSCGRGNPFSEGDSLAGFSVVNPICLDYFSHTHEFGLNLGCYPNRENAEIQTEYAHGYQACSEESHPFRTIMTGSCTPPLVPRVNWFSNPEMSYLGRPTGTATEDCARKIMDNMVTVSNFRESASQYNPAPTTLASNPIPSTGVTSSGTSSSPLPTSILTIPAPPTTGPVSHATSTLALATLASATPTPTQSTLATTFPNPSDPSIPTTAGTALETLAPSTVALETSAPLTPAPSTVTQTTQASSTLAPTTPVPTTHSPTTPAPSTLAPSTIVSSALTPTIPAPVTPTLVTLSPAGHLHPTPTNDLPITPAPLTPKTPAPVSGFPYTSSPTTPVITGTALGTLAPFTGTLTTPSPTTPAPSTTSSTPQAPTLLSPTKHTPTTSKPSMMFPVPVTNPPSKFIDPQMPTSTKTIPITLSPITANPVTLAPSLLAPHTPEPVTPGLDSRSPSALAPSMPVLTTASPGTPVPEPPELVTAFPTTQTPTTLVSTTPVLATPTPSTQAPFISAPLAMSATPAPPVYEKHPCPDSALVSGLVLFNQSSYEYGAGDCDMHKIVEELVDAVQADDMVTVIGEVLLGTIMCESLAAAEGAPFLRFAISTEEMIVVEATSFSVLNGEAFSDGIERKVWAGKEVSNDFGAPFFRTVSMSWATECNVETFLLKVTTNYVNGNLSLAKSVPCLPGETIATCFLEVELEPEDEEGPYLSLNETDVVPTNARLLRGSNGYQARGDFNRGAGVSASNTRRLESSPTTIDVMMLFNEGGKEKLGGISDAQMQTTIATALSSSNEAFANSGINLEFTLVYVGLLPYNESGTTSSVVLENLVQDEDVAELRDAYGADLVQLAGDIGYFSCGRGYLLSEGENLAAFSVVSPNCFVIFSHTHEFGHNLGCYHDRDNAEVQAEYAHGYPDCSAEVDPFRTIMSYPCTPTTVLRVNLFSNPNISYSGRPTGTATEDCARNIMENMVTVSNYRDSVSRTSPAPTTLDSITPMTPAPTTATSRTQAPSTPVPTTPMPMTLMPVTTTPSVFVSSTPAPTIPMSIATASITPTPTTLTPTSLVPATGMSSTRTPSYIQPTSTPITTAPTTEGPATYAPNTLTQATLVPVTLEPRTPSPVTALPITPTPKTPTPVNAFPATPSPSTPVTTGIAQGTLVPSSIARGTSSPITPAPSTVRPTTQAPGTLAPTIPLSTAPAHITPSPITHLPSTPITTLPITPTLLPSRTPAPVSDTSSTPFPTAPVTTSFARGTLAPSLEALTRSIPLAPIPSTASPTTRAPNILSPTNPTPITLEPMTTPASTAPEPETPTLVTVSPTAPTPLVPMPTTLAFTTPVPHAQAPTYSAPLKTSTPAPPAHEEHPSADSAFESGLVLFDQASYEHGAGNYHVQEVIEKLVDAVQADDKVTVVGEVLLGELMCESFAAAEDAPFLRFAINQEETIVAEGTSYSVVNGEVFTDGLERKVWSGKEVNYTLGAPYFRTVSMSWATECHVETFLIKVTTNYENGTLFLTKSVPCLQGESIVTCFLEVKLTPEEEEESSLPVNRTAAEENTRRLRGPNGYQQWKEPHRRTGVSTYTARKLESENTTIDVMMLFDEGGKEKLGGISDAQMQTTLASALSSSNEAFAHSGINLEFSLVYVGLLPYTESDTTSSVVLDNLAENEDVAKLRDAYGADLVQLAGDIGYFSCGRGYIYSEGDDLEGFSVVNPICLDYFSHTHEFGHNLGCYHNRENAETETKYAHGYQDCDEEIDPFRTIMSYTCTPVTVPRVNWFSNPNVSYLGRPTGTTTEDCARNIMENMVTVSNFRESVSQSTQAPTPSPTTSSFVTWAPTTSTSTQAPTSSPTTSSFVTWAPTTSTSTQAPTSSPTTSALITWAPSTSTSSTAIPTTQALRTIEPTTSALFTPTATPAPSDGSSTATELPACLDQDSTSYRCNGRSGGTIIDLNRCELTDEHAHLLRACFEEAAGDVSSIEKIKLNQNDFTTLPGDLLDGMTSLSTLNLQNNCNLACVPHVEEQAGPDVILTSACNNGAAAYECDV